MVDSNKNRRRFVSLLGVVRIDLILRSRRLLGECRYVRWRHMDGACFDRRSGWPRIGGVHITYILWRDRLPRECACWYLDSQPRPRHVRISPLGRVSFRRVASGERDSLIWDFGVLVFSGFAAGLSVPVLVPSTSARDDRRRWTRPGNRLPAGDTHGSVHRSGIADESTRRVVGHRWYRRRHAETCRESASSGRIACRALGAVSSPARSSSEPAGGATTPSRAPAPRSRPPRLLPARLGSGRSAFRVPASRRGGGG